MARESFNDVWANDPVDADFDRPTSTMWGKGWRGGEDQDPPKSWAQNWWQNRVDNALQDIERYGAMRWIASSEYRIGAIVIASDGNKYIAVSGTDSSPNRYSDPTTDLGENWQRYYDATPTGAILMYPVSNAPVGFLELDGGEHSREEYPNLFAVIGTQYGSGDGYSTFNVPDMRGEFPRGWDNGRGVDSGRSLGSQQAGQIESHNHSGNTSLNGEHSHGGNTDYSGNHSHDGSTNYTGGHRHGYDQAQDPDYSHDGQGSIDTGEDYAPLNYSGRNTDYTGDHSHSLNIENAGKHRHDLNIENAGNHTHNLNINNTGGNETRPRNVALMFCIKT